MHFLIDVVKVIVLFLCGYMFVTATSKCHAKENHDAFGWGVMFSVTTLMVLFRVLMTM